VSQIVTLPGAPERPVTAYLAEPAGRPKGGIVVIQEIFGVNAHIRDVCDRFAALGYTAIAPSFFDHLQLGIDLGYTQEDMQLGLKLIGELGLARAVDDVAAAAKAIASSGKVGTVGYCWGGTIALMAALRLGLPSVSYYGSRNVPFLTETPKAPVMFHFGEKDHSIPPEMVQKHRELLPQMETFVYPAGHGFNRDIGESFDAPSAELALKRTMAFFEKHLA
jgi:carboxymethylenebutenolidase